MHPEAAQPELRFLSLPAAPGTPPRRLAWWDWPCVSAHACRQIVVCVHGLSRQGRDFDTLARALQTQARVVAVDVAGRGHSDWLSDPMAYQIPTYVADLAALLAHLRAQAPDACIDWVGTSMGGLIGMALAAQPATAPRRLVLNDVGPVIQWDALRRIASYLGQNPSFETAQAAVDYLAAISPGFGPHTPAQWQALSLPMLREREGRWWLHYDPAIAVPLRAMLQADPAIAEQARRDGEAALWGLYDAIRAPTLLLRGEQSDLLTRNTADEMTRRGPHARCVECPGVGHAPTLVDPLQVRVVRDFLCTD